MSHWPTTPEERRAKIVADLEQAARTWAAPGGYTGTPEEKASWAAEYERAARLVSSKPPPCDQVFVDGVTRCDFVHDPGEPKREGGPCHHGIDSFGQDVWWDSRRTYRPARWAK